MNIRESEQNSTTGEQTDEGKEVLIHVLDEVERFFDDSSLPKAEKPELVILMGGVATGKTTIRKEKYSSGYVVLDAPEIFLSLSRGKYYDFPVAFQEPMDLIGGMVAIQAVAERRNIVIELIGGDFAELKALMDAMLAIGYTISVHGIFCELEEAVQRNLSRGDDSISAHYAEPFQRRWLFDAAKDALALGADKSSQ